jgi:hypothetical protein
VSKANPKQFGNSPISVGLTHGADFIISQISQKIQRLSLGAHATVIAN